MAHQNLKIQKEKEYNPFAFRTIKRETVGKVKCYLKAVKLNPKDVFGGKKINGQRYNNKVFCVTHSNPSAEQYDRTKIYFYEVGANDGSYRKCTSEEDALMRFGQLVEFEKRQTEIR